MKFCTKTNLTKISCHSKIVSSQFYHDTISKFIVAVFKKKTIGSLITKSPAKIEKLTWAGVFLKAPENSFVHRSGPGPQIG